jgi:hypothetical protein
MQLNTLGLVAAITVFFSIWSGHVAVRKIEFIAPTIWLPTTIFAVFGAAAEILSLFMIARPWSVAFGILGFTLLFDAFEYTRQQNRVKIGHAPANRNNPRHAVILADSKFHATTIDLLKRNPTGEPVDPAQAITLIAEH